MKDFEKSIEVRMMLNELFVFFYTKIIHGDKQQQVVGGRSTDGTCITHVRSEKKKQIHNITKVYREKLKKYLNYMMIED